MFIQLKLHRDVSRKTAAQLRGYLADFGAGPHRIFWRDDGAVIEVEHADDVQLLRSEFPNIVSHENEDRQTGFPW
ncbi:MULTISPECIES: hypothetical protein [unclassified Paracoccus (in: a-proteobacteria)]|uniref:hypothetical protein n=1 Tax=unclassified Paracoccus (in: a-proteobacteria) TaxID=2688777 RepID=UPI0012B3D334|nr:MULTISPECIES: hypothetical protein [unclassified Paracoccus (in: a-proteobacteria)]UXU74185.1 hypothetical protein GB879_009725 [Paracoccus sp. SMMA_5]UXU80073.1 hypothetical protein GB880_009695 [Paracoccus sp. SMMA_5_TC]